MFTADHPAAYVDPLLRASYRGWTRGRDQPVEQITAVFEADNDTEVDSIVMQVRGPRQLQALINHLLTFGVTRMVFPAREYRSEPLNAAQPRSVYETARLLPHGGDGGFAEQFLGERARKASDTRATHDL
jgi:hypothetical protein